MVNPWHSGDEPTAPLYVTRPDLPPLDELMPHLEAIWASGFLTNNGQYHRRFEAALAAHLAVRNVSVFSSGTSALVTALHALGRTGTVVTTPYTFVATAHSAVWAGHRPVFADITPGTFNLDPERVAEAITPDTTAILAVHCYGYPCDVEGLQAVGDEHGLPVIYDAAHAFGVRDAQGRSVLEHGAMSVLSFHATKVFTTFEGGAIVTHDEESRRHIGHLRNFGFVDETTVVGVGVNGKMNEFQAAVGLLQLDRIDAAVAARAVVDAGYRELLDGVGGLTLPPDLGPGQSNYSYFPLLVGPGFRTSRDELYAEFRRHEIYARRYFYPLVSDFPMYQHLPSSARSNLPHAATAADQILCLPIYPGLPLHAVERIAAIVRGSHFHRHRPEQENLMTAPSSASIEDLVLEAIAEVTDSRIRAALALAFEAERESVETIEESFRIVTTAPPVAANLRTFFRTWNMTNNSAMCVAGMGNRMTQQHRDGTALDPVALADAVASLHRINDEDLGVGNGVIHADLFYSMATTICGGDEWQSKRYLLEAGIEFKRWRDRCGLVDKDVVVGLLATLIHEVYTHAEVEFIWPHFNRFLETYFEMTSTERHKTLTWINVHRNGTETGHFAHAQDATASYLASQGLDLDGYDMVAIFREYLRRKAEAMRAIIEAPAMTSVVASG